MKRAIAIELPVGVRSSPPIWVVPLIAVTFPKWRSSCIVRVVQLARPDHVDRGVAEAFEHPGGGRGHPRRGGEQDRRPGLGGEPRDGRQLGVRGERRHHDHLVGLRAAGAGQQPLDGRGRGGRRPRCERERAEVSRAPTPSSPPGSPVRPPSEAAPSGCRLSIASELTPGSEPPLLKIRGALRGLLASDEAASAVWKLPSSTTTTASGRLEGVRPG